MKTSIDGCLPLIERLQEALEQADAVVIGAGAGLSTSAGFTYSGERFEKYFGDFIARYGFGDMYSGGFYPFGSLEEHWAYWSRYLYINRYMDAPKPVYSDLLQLVRDKDYFVLTTNVDHCFQKAGFEKTIAVSVHPALQRFLPGYAGYRSMLHWRSLPSSPIKTIYPGALSTKVGEKCCKSLKFEKSTICLPKALHDLL